ncbi:hypothetical protein ACERII_02065 [Evansella sp. AB-rgal1]|uniref:hypothetical protein n=1 Tax=Evansella sp. AB-rgal1 TaxID=3242696 RepID=UPI00359F0845
MVRKHFTTTIEESISQAFKESCAENKVRMNEVLEAFMKSYSAGEFKVEMEYKISKNEDK